MADDVKGLSIKFGGDASELKKALVSVNQAARQTQSQLRAVGRSLKISPQNTGLINRQLKELSKEAENTALKMSKTKASIKKLGSERIAFFDSNKSKEVVTTIDELAKKTKNAGLEAAQAKQRYVEINKELERMYAANNQKGKPKLQTLSNKELASKSTTSWLGEEKAAEILRLREAWKQATSEAAAYDKVVQLENMRASLQDANFKLRSLNTEMLKLDGRSSFAKQSRDVQKLDSSIAQCDTRLAQLKQNGEKLDRALKLDPNNIQLVSLKVRNLQEQEEAAKNKAELLKQKLDSYKNTDAFSKVKNSQKDWTAEVQRTEQAYTNAKQKLESAKGTIAEIKEKIRTLNVRDGGKGTSSLENDLKKAEQNAKTLDVAMKKAFKDMDTAHACSEIKQVQTELVETKAQAQGAANELTRLSSRHGASFDALARVGGILSSTITPVVAAAGYASVSAAQEIDASFRNMKKTVNGTPEQFEALRKAAVDFSTTHVTSASQILEIEALGGQLGVAADKLGAFAEVTSNLDIATNLNAEEIATSLGQLSNIMGDLTHDNLPRFGDALVRLGNNMPTQESNILEVTNRIASAGQIFGFTTPQVLAWATAIAATGQNSEAAGTAMSKTFSTLQGIVDGTVTHAGAKMDLLAKTMHMSADEFAEAWSTKPSETLQKFIESLKGVKDNGESVDAVLAGLGINSVRQKQAIEGLLNTTDVLNDSLTISQDAWNGVSDKWGAAGDAAREAAQKSEGFSGALEKIKNVAKAAGDSLGQSFAPILSKTADVAKDVFKGFDGLSSGTKTSITGIAVFMGLLGPALKLLGGFGLGAVEAGKYLGGFGNVFSQVLKDSKTFNGALESVQQGLDAVEGNTVSLTGAMATLKTAGIAVLIVGLVALAKGIYDCWKRQKDFEDSLNAVRDATTRAVNLNQYRDGIAGAGQVAKLSAKSFEEFTESIKNHAKAMDENAKQAESEIGKLNSVQGILKDSIGKTDLNAEAQGRLTWAIKEFNEATGESITAQDVMNGKYTDANGQVQDLSAHIDELIKKKKEEARINALTKNLEEAYSTQAEAQNQYAAEQQAWKDAYERNKKYYAEHSSEIKKTGDKRTAEEYAKGLADGAHKDKIDEYKKSIEEATLSVERHENALGEAGKTLTSVAAGYETLAQKLSVATKGMFEASLQPGVGIADLSQKLSEAGISVEDFAQLTSEQLTSIAENWDGSTASLLENLMKQSDGFKENKENIINALAEQAAKCEEFAQIEVGDKHYSISDDGTIYGNIKDLQNLAQFTIAGKNYWVTDDGTVFNEMGKLGNVNDFKVGDKHYKVTDDGSVQETTNGVKDLGIKIASIPSSKTTTFDGNTKPLMDKINSARNALDRVGQTVVSVLSGIPHAAGGILRQHASGAFIASRNSMRLHADGFIANQPTMITPKDVVGEAGAEAIIPLTNKKYVSPFAGTVAEEMLKRIGGSGQQADPALLASVVARSIRNELEGFELVVNNRELGRFVRSSL
ncbi:phage tail tape measure protein [Atopobium fossor]|uniref:phage tail tape measure protein n=1 Tax=Atopobium fossor TaxID=39487 RepID=UPI000413AFB7|nr:phage tail tape measure protein [Atopobium fossor]